MDDADAKLREGLNFMIDVCADMRSELISLKERVRQIELMLYDDGR